MSVSSQPTATPTVIERDLIKLSGDLVHSSVVAIDGGGQARIAQAGNSVRIDLSGVGRVDSSALALLLGWQRQAKQLGKNIQLAFVPANLASIMQLTGADVLFEVEHS